MKESLKKLNDKVDNCRKAVEDLSDLTKQLPQWVSDFSSSQKNYSKLIHLINFLFSFFFF
jgi:hypothetical protein